MWSISHLVETSIGGKGKGTLLIEMYYVHYIIYVEDTIDIIKIKVID
jgi:hypothetical protein